MVKTIPRGYICSADWYKGRGNAQNIRKVAHVDVRHVTRVESVSGTFKKSLESDGTEYGHLRHYTACSILATFLGFPRESAPRNRCP